MIRLAAVGLGLLSILSAQNSATAHQPAAKQAQAAAAAGEYVLEPGTRIPLSMINSVSTKHAAAGDRIYLETVFPIMAKGRIVIPPGSYVAGTVTGVKRPGRIKGRGELYVRFDSLTLPNGVTRDFRARIGSLDGRTSEELDRNEGKIRSEGNKVGDARTIGEAAGTGASAGTIAGAVGGNTGMGAGIGAAAGATAGLIGVLLSRGPEAMLTKGTTLEMVLDRPLRFTADELNFGATYRPRRRDSGDETFPPRKKRRHIPIPGTRLPL